ncbi:MAG: hypothetical protein QG673_1257, partial [Pseudomonadota bacterium]|nr:hypothetical protein [Pseudomonadota bacterium]
MINYKITP